MKKILFSFGDWRYYPTLDFLKESAQKNAGVDEILVFKESDIESSFYKKNIKHFNDKRGFGYWIWKSYFFNKLLAKAKKDDVFLYVDAGNEIINKLDPLFEICQKDSKGITLFDNSDNNPRGEVWKNNLWTKSDTFNLMGLRSEKYIYGNQINASYIVFRKTKYSIKFFEYFQILSENYNIISDAPNITENFNKDFLDHRHDQSILSLLSIRYRFKIERDPSETGNIRMLSNAKYPQLFRHFRRKYYLFP